VTRILDAPPAEARAAFREPEPPPLPRWALELARAAVDLRQNGNRCTIVVNLDGAAWQLLKAMPVQRGPID
jgi:hypothetical protein